MLQTVILWFKEMAQVVPLPAFVMVGGFVEEILAPIPSSLVMTLAGSIAAAQEGSIPSLFWICVLATLAKTVGAWLFYVLGDKVEHLAVPRFGRYIGVTHRGIENLRTRFSGTWRDEVTLFVLRLIPVMPSTPVSIVSGILKINIRTFFFSTYAGFYVRNMIFISLGYTGLAAAESLMTGIDAAETALKVGVVLFGVAVLGWLYWKRRTGSPVTWLRR